MALTGNYIPFYSIVEKVYRDAGFQQIDWNDAIEWIGDVIGLIGAKDAFKTITTNSIDGPSPLEIIDYRATIPIGFINLIAARKVSIDSEANIVGYQPMVYSTDMFFQSPFKKIQSQIPAGQYSFNDWIRVDVTNATTEFGVNIVVGAKIHDLNLDVYWEATSSLIATDTITSALANLISVDPSLVSLDGEYTYNPTIVQGMQLGYATDFNLSYRINATYIETNFEDGFVELTYSGFVTDDDGFPMIPDEARYREAVTSFLIERLDYKAWRKGILPDKVYQKSSQERDWYIGAARNKANIPSIDRMESIKNMFLRSIQKVTSHQDGFRYSNLPERRKV